MKTETPLHSRLRERKLLLIKREKKANVMNEFQTLKRDNLSAILKSACSYRGNFNKYNLTYLVIFTKRIRKAMFLTKLLNDLALYKLEND